MASLLLPASSHDAQMFFSQQPIDTGGEVFTQAEGEDFVDQADASQETLRCTN